MSHWSSDVRFSLRLMRRSPGFFGALIAIVMIGIGATTAMFSIVQSLLLKPLPYPHAEQLTMVWRSDPQIPWGAASVPDFLDWRERATTFESMAALSYAGFSLSSEGAAPEETMGARVSADYFPMLGIRALHGRLLNPDDDRIGAPRVAVLSASLWHRRFASDPQMIGRTITLDAEPFTVIGVAPEGFAFAGPHMSRSEVWTSLAATSALYAKSLDERSSHFLTVLGRRKPSVSVSQAQAELSSIAQQLEQAFPEDNKHKGVLLVDLHEELVKSSRSGVWVLFAAVVLVFVIVCANVANLLLTRAQARRAEMAVRAALGATFGRLCTQLLTETVVLFVCGALGGILLSRWWVDLFASGLIEGPGARTIDIQVNAVALLFSIGTCLVCGLLFGLAPALSVARVEPQTVLKTESARAGIGRRQKVVRSGLVIAQIALAFSLLVGSGLALRAFTRLAETPVGFDPDKLATGRLILSETKYAADDKAIDFYRQVIDRVAAEPGVASVAANSTLPMSGSRSSSSFKIEGRPAWPTGEGPDLERNVVTPGYFGTMGIPILRGRDFSDADQKSGRLVMVVSQSVAERFFSGTDPIGQRIDLDNGSSNRFREIIGVVGDIRHRGIDEPIAMESYVPLMQEPNRWMALVARSAQPNALLQRLPALVQAIDPEQAVSNRKLMSERVSESVRSQRYVTTLLAAFAAAALVLAVLGIFGLMSFLTNERTRELGIRMALGATPRSVARLVLLGGLRLIALGMAVGLVLSLLLGRLLSSHVSGVSGFDALTYTIIPLFIGTTGLLACALPAWRAVRIPPAIALRYG